MLDDWQIEVFQALRPPPSLTTSQWADAERYLPIGLTAEPGRWKTSRVEYTRGIMDAFDNPEYETISIQKSSQVAITSTCENKIGKGIENDPCPMIFARPTIDSVRKFVKERFDPMIEGSAKLKALLPPARSRDSSNTILHKMFPGGHITFVGGNSPTTAKSTAAKVIFVDEIDDIKPSIGGQGDFVEMLERRSETYPDSLLVLLGAPTVKWQSRIEASFLSSDQQYYFVPCPKCGFMQFMSWKGVKWINRKPSTAVYECESCSHTFKDQKRYDIVHDGEWRKTNPKVINHGGFFINFLMSPWARLSSKVDKFLKVKKNAERLQVFVNQELAEAFEETGEKADAGTLFGRREKYKAAVPNGGLVLTSFVDQQKDRLEILTCAWGHLQESWIIEHKILYGNPAAIEVWKELDLYIENTRFENENGVKLKIPICGVDSGDGNYTKYVYEFVKNKEHRRIFATKGANVEAAPLVNMPRKKQGGVLGKGKVTLFIIGVHAGKTSLMARLKLSDPGPGFIHIPMTIDEEFCKQLTSEELRTKFIKGFPRREWHKVRNRNEGLDLMVGNIAMFELLNPDLDTIEKILKQKSLKSQERKLAPKSHKRGWATQWKK